MNPYESGAVIDMNMGHNSATPASIGAYALRHALEIAEAALADIGDADREPGDDVAWCEARAAEALPTVRAALASAAQPPTTQAAPKSAPVARPSEDAVNRASLNLARKHAVYLSRESVRELLAEAAPVAQGDALPREEFAWMVVQEACETEPADEDDPECIRILRRDLKSAVLAAFLREDAARAAEEGDQHG